MTTAHLGTRHAPLTGRLSSIDTLRGIVMILMALDHVRDFFGVPGLSPTNLAQTTVPLFFTRWITHLCAPTFFLLTGTGAFLALGRRTIPQLSRFLLTRGLWLVLLEVTVIRTGFQFNVDYHVTMLIVIWALGWAMIALAALCWLPLPAILAFGVAMIAGHNLLDGVRSTHPIWVMLHSQGVVVNQPGFVVFVAYPLVPWIGVTAVGFVLGRIYTWNPERRRAFLLRCGLGLTAAFLLLRAANVYGDRAPWVVGASPAMTLISFFNVTKYPPSLLFLLMALGPALLILRALDNRNPRLLQPALVFGQVPLFYFVAAPAADTPAGGRPDLHAERRRPLDVRVARPWRVPVHAAARLGALATVDLSAVGRRGRDAVPGVRVVCRRQAAAVVAVVELSVIAWTDRR